MNKYECVFLSRHELAPQQVDALVQEYSSVIQGEKGKVVATENAGLKSLMYKIKKNSKANFCILHIEAPAGAVAEMERKMRIDENVLRYLTTKVEEFEKLPSVLTQSSRYEKPAYNKYGSDDADVAERVYPADSNKAE